MGDFPCRSTSCLVGSLSYKVTSCPNSAKHTAVTNPTYPDPITEMRIPSSKSSLPNAIARWATPFCQCEIVLYMRSQWRRTPEQGQRRYIGQEKFRQVTVISCAAGA